MRWRAAPKWEGFIRYECESAAGYFLCQKKTGTGRWRLAFKAAPEEAFKIIFTAGTLKSCKDYAETYQPE